MTLDEVITALEQGLRSSIFEDALHYLKEYRETTGNPDGDHQQLIKAQALLQDFYRNDPLSWDELRQMEGKPVWIIDANNKGRWYLVKAIDEEAIFTDFWGNSGIGYPKDYGKSWQAYRKERE